MFGFGRRLSAADLLRRGRWQCASCDEEHGWPFDLAAFAPDPWPGPGRYEPNSALRLEGDFLSEDFCVLGGEHFMICAVLPIPVVGLGEEFAFGCWTTLSQANFKRYVDAFDNGHQDQDIWFGWLVNRLANLVDSQDPLALEVQPRPNRQRPLLWVKDDNHPLARAQAQGISAERVMEIFRRYGHAPV